MAAGSLERTEFTSASSGWVTPISWMAALFSQCAELLRAENARQLCDPEADTR
jgi:hypothetical protein